MALYRLFTGTDKEAHVEKLILSDEAYFLNTQPNAGVTIKAYPPRQFLDWHPAPRRQWVIILSGELEIGVGDGTSHRFGPGDARLVEDTPGRGHTTKTIGD